MTDRKLKAAFESAHSTENEQRKALYAVQMRRKTAVRRRVAAVLQTACACLAAVLVIVFVNIYGSETAYISLDINPSISLAINDYGRVIEATGYNRESDDILQTVKVAGQPYEAAVSDVLSSSNMQPYLEENGTLWIAVQARSPMKTAEMEQIVIAAAQNALAAYEPFVSIEAGTVNEETRVTAEGAGVSATKYLAICELQELDPSASVDSYRDAAIHEIHEAAEAASHHSSGLGTTETPVPNPANLPAAATENPSSPPPAQEAVPEQTQAIAETAPPPVQQDATSPGQHHGEGAQHHGNHHG